MKYFWFLFLLAVSCVLSLRSFLPIETPFFVVFASLSFFSRGMTAFFLILAGVCLDIFSPIKGLSLIGYGAGIGVCIALSHTLITNRSLPAFLILGISGWFTVVIVKLLITIGFNVFVTGYSLSSMIGTPFFIHFFEAFVVNILFLSILFYVVSSTAEGLKRGVAHY